VAIRRCPYCKAIIDESQKYCNNCGTQLLFPEDDLSEEPIKGEKILDEDFKDEGEKGFDEPADDLGLEREDIDLEAVLKGAGHFPDEPAIGRGGGEFKREPSAPISEMPPEPSSPPAPARRPPRPRKKTESAGPKNDTREEIARLIAALEEKEKKSEEPTAAPLPSSPPEEDLKTPLDQPFLEPESAPPKESFQIPGEEPARAASSWEDFLKKPVTTDLENGPLPGAFEADEENDSDAGIEMGEQSGHVTAGDTMDFEAEVFRHTPPPMSSPTRMGIPEGVSGDSMRLPRLDDGIEPEADEEPRFSRDVEFRPQEAVPAAVETAEAAEEETPPLRLGFFRKIGALLFDFIFIGAICLASLWLAARLMDVALFDLIKTARVPIGLYFLVLLFGYFFLFLFFLGETLGDRIASRRS
jgi:hypothetical protein